MKNNKLNKSSNKVTTTCDMVSLYQRWLTQCINEISCMKELVQVYRILKKHKIFWRKDIDKIDNIQERQVIDKVMAFSLPENYYQIEEFQQEKVIIKDLRVTQGGNISTKLFSEYLKQIQLYLEKYDIPKPTEEQLFQVKCLLTNELADLRIEDLTYGATYDQIQNIQSNYSKPRYHVEDYTAEINYYKIQAWKINNQKWRQCENQNKDQFFAHKIDEYYDRLIKLHIDYIYTLENEALPQWKATIYELSKKRGVIRPNEYYASQNPYTRQIKLQEIKTFEKNAERVLKLLEKEAPAEYQKLLHSQGNDYDPDTVAIPLLIGKKLSKNASIAFKALTYLIYREYYQGRVNSLNSKATVKASDFWRLCNIKSTASGYDYRSKEKIKEAVKELKEEILHESKKMFLVTSFVLNFLWEENGQTISFQLDDLFLVYKDQEEMHYYYSDLEGCNRFMDATNNSEKAYWLHHYLEYSLKSCTQTFNFSVILEKAGLSARYKVAKNQTKQKVFDFLNKMVSEKTLIDGWDLIPSDSDEEGKFRLSNLRTWNKVTHIDEKLKQKNKSNKVK